MVQPVALPNALTSSAVNVNLSALRNLVSHNLNSTRQPDAKVKWVKVSDAVSNVLYITPLTTSCLDGRDI